jgi:hypothetical protein
MGGKKETMAKPQFEFDWKASPGEVVSELSTALEKYGIGLEATDGTWGDSYYFNLRVNPEVLTAVARQFKGKRVTSRGKAGKITVARMCEKKETNP